jgi:UDP:flavonoid glycosyltransferase YjiC (YdhE family)
MTLVFYISGHGLGHASREVEVVNAVAARRGDVRFIIRSAAPPWLLELSRRVGVEIQPFEADTGVAQIDSLRLDEPETARRAAAFYRDIDRRVDAEAAFLRDGRAALVVGDIPPLAFSAAASAGVPSIAIGNFTWDWIYHAYPAFNTAAPGVIDLIRDAYGHATSALRLPMHGGFEPMASVTRDIPFIARRSVRDREEARRGLGVSGGRPLVLASFGGYGLELPYDVIAQSGRLTVIAPPREAPDGLSYQDLVAAADVVVSKPGYGIISECVANGTALLYTSRGHFVEYEVLTAAMPAVLRCRYIPQEDLLAGRWADHVEALLQQPPPPERPRVDGSEVAAEEILNLAIG